MNYNIVYLKSICIFVQEIRTKKISIMKPGEQVKFKNPMSEFEKTAIYEITNINDGTNRALITHVNGNLPIATTELVSLNDIELV